MTTLTVAAEVVNQDVWRKRVRMVSCDLAVDVMYEAGGGVHTDRVVFAEKILTGQNDQETLLYTLMTDSTVLSTLSVTAAENGVTDATMKNSLSAHFNALAGIETNV